MCWLSHALVCGVTSVRPESLNLGCGHMRGTGRLRLLRGESLAPRIRQTRAPARDLMPVSCVTSEAAFRLSGPWALSSLHEMSRGRLLGCSDDIILSASHSAWRDEPGEMEN